MSVPWYAHLATGAVAIAAGLAMMLMGDVETGAFIVGSGVTFLGVGAGVAASNPVYAGSAPAAPPTAPAMKVQL
ncbi:MAG: hypothetical protein ACYDDA_13270 [Acidiferrobacteraceae bacterium]